MFASFLSTHVDFRRTFYDLFVLLAWISKYRHRCVCPPCQPDSKCQASQPRLSLACAPLTPQHGSWGGVSPARSFPTTAASRGFSGLCAPLGTLSLRREWTPLHQEDLIWVSWLWPQFYWMLIDVSLGKDSVAKKLGKLSTKLNEFLCNRTSQNLQHGMWATDGQEDL